MLTGTDGQTDRQADRQAGRQADRQTYVLGGCDSKNVIEYSDIFKPEGGHKHIKG